MWIIYMFVYYTLFDYTARYSIIPFKYLHFRTPFRSHQTGPLCSRTVSSLLTSVGVSCCGCVCVDSPALSMAVKLHTSSESPHWHAQEEAARECSRALSWESSSELSWQSLPSPSGGNIPEGLKRPRHDDKNLPWPKRISLTLRWTPFGSRWWLSMRVVRSWNEGACIFFSLVVQREDKMAARARRACSGCELNPNMFTKDPRFDHNCCLWR